MDKKKISIDVISFYKNIRFYKSDPSFIYRCLNLASVLKEKNILGYLGHVKNYRPNSGTTHVFFLRPVYSLPYFFLVKKLKMMGVKIIADVDDLIIHPDFSIYSPAFVNGILSVSTISKNYNKNYKALSLCDHICTSTEELANKISLYFVDKGVTLLENCVFHSWGDKKNKGGVKNITYFSGTRSHNKDFLIARNSLEQFINSHDDVILNITGCLDFNINIPKRNLIFSEKVSFLAYQSLVSQSWVNISPLDITPFNHCKSALKVIEAGFFGIPTVCSPNPDVDKFRSLAAIEAGEDDWFFILEDLYGKNINSKAIKEDVMKKANIKKIYEKFYTEVL